MGTNPRGLRKFGESRGIRTFAYGAVGEPGPNEELLSSPVLNRIGEAHGGRKPEEVALRWVTQNGCAVSVRPTLDFGLGTGVCTEENKCKEGMDVRASSFGWNLTAKEMKELNSLTSPNDNPTLFSSAGCPDAFVMKK
jgi:diketogulonate reductase-like aldo/keto reductase